MAKQIGTMQFSGKLGEVVGSKKSANQRYNTIRKRVLSIKNTNSQLQREQRIKITPANNVYRALSEVLNHSFQSVAVGAACHDKFNKLALMMDSGFPYLEKGDLRPIPGEYQVSTGSLINGMIIRPINNIVLVVTQNRPDNPVSLVENEQLGIYEFKPNVTWGEISQDLISATTGLNDGDQITFMLCHRKEIDGEGSEKYFWEISRIVIDANSSQSLQDYATMMKMDIRFNSDEDRFEFWDKDGGTVAAATIISRQSNSGDGSWLRSDSKIVVSDWVKDIFMNENAKQAAIASYNTKKNGKSSLYLNQANSRDSKAKLIYNVAISSEENSAVTTLGAGTFLAGSNVTVSFATTNPNIHFEGWYENGTLVSESANYSFEIDKNRSLVAQWSLSEGE